MKSIASIIQKIGLSVLGRGIASQNRGRIGCWALGRRRYLGRLVLFRGKFRPWNSNSFKIHTN